MPENPSVIFDSIKYQNDMQEKAENNGRWNSTQANKVDSELCNNLMLLDTVALTATIIVLSDERSLDALSKGSAIMLIITSVCIVASIFLGIANYIVLNRFQRRWSRINQSIASAFASQPLSPADMQVISIQRQANVPTESQRVFWYGQITFLCIALLLYLAIIITVLGHHLSTVTK